MPLSDLTKIVTPPAVPTNGGSQADVGKLESKVGVVLPSDYLEYGIIYGSGRMYDGFIRVMNPFSPSYVKWRSGSLQRLEVEKMGKHLDDYDIFPAKDGLLPWGEDENGANLCWKTLGDPEHWPIIVVGHNGCIEEWPMSFSLFLAQVFQNQIQSQIWLEPFSKERLDFTPQ